jgi:hypothetical protein
MAFANGAGGDRRRRVLNEQVMGRSEAVAGPSGSAGARAEGPRYAPEALKPAAPLVGLLPRSWSVIALVGFAGLAAVAGVLALHLHLPDLQALVSDAHLATFDLNSPASLASSLMAFSLLLAAVFSVAIYSVRRHRVDDYRARYRVWVWSALTCFVASLCAASGLHRPIADLVPQLLAPLGLGEAAAWWFAAPLAWLGYVGVRWVRDVIESRVAAVLLVAASASWIASNLIGTPWLPVALSHAALLSHGLVLAGAVLLLMALAVYGRYVVRDAAGEIAQRPAKAKRPRKEKKSKPAAAKSEKPSKKDNEDAQTGTRSTGRRKNTAPQPDPTPVVKRNDLDVEEVAEESDEKSYEEWWEETESGGRPKRKLTKAERKRMRKANARKQNAA